MILRVDRPRFQMLPLLGRPDQQPRRETVDPPSGRRSRRIADVEPNPRKVRSLDPMSLIHGGISHICSFDDSSLTAPTRGGYFRQRARATTQRAHPIARTTKLNLKTRRRPESTLKSRLVAIVAREPREPRTNEPKLSRGPRADEPSRLVKPSPETSPLCA